MAERPESVPSRRGSHGYNYNRAVLITDDSFHTQEGLQRGDSSGGGMRPITTMRQSHFEIFEDARRLYMESVTCQTTREGKGFEFLAYLSIDQDGGFHKVDQLWSEIKVVWFVLLLALTFMNFFAILITDVQLLRQFHSNSSWDHPLQQLPTDVNSKELRGDMVIFSWAEPDVLKYFTYSSVAVAYFELAQLVYFSGIVIEDIIAFLWNRRLENEAFYAWNAVVRLFQEDIQTLSTFSAMKALRNVHPSLMVEAFADWTREFQCVQNRACAITTFVLSRLFYLAFGIGALAVKTASVGLHITHPGAHRVANLLLMISFMNQVMGIIVLDVVLQRRIFLFIFGGKDAELEDDERSLKHAYLAALMREMCRIMTKDWQGGFSDKLKALILVATFDHYDLQQLVLEEDTVKKSKLAVAAGH